MVLRGVLAVLAVRLAGTFAFDLGAASVLALDIALGAGVEEIEFMDAEDRNHLTIVMRMVGSGRDPVRDRIVKFVQDRCRMLDRAK